MKGCNFLATFFIKQHWSGFFTLRVDSLQPCANYEKNIFSIALVRAVFFCLWAVEPG